MTKFSKYRRAYYAPEMDYMKIRYKKLLSKSCFSLLKRLLSMGRGKSHKLSFPPLPPLLHDPYLLTTVTHFKDGDRCL